MFHSKGAELHDDSTHFQISQANLRHYGIVQQMVSLLIVLSSPLGISADVCDFTAIVLWPGFPGDQ